MGKPGVRKEKRSDEETGSGKGGIHPGLEKGVHPGQAKWRTRRLLRSGMDHKDIDLVPVSLQPTSGYSWYKTAASPISYQGPHTDGHTRGLKKKDRSGYV